MQVSNISHHAPLGKSDHSIITFNFHCYLDYTKPKARFNYNKTDYQMMRDYLPGWKENILSTAQDANVEDLWCAIKQKLHEVRDKFVPKTKVSGKPTWKNKGSPPIEKPLQELIRKKQICHRRWMSTKNRPGNDQDRTAYNKARNKVKNTMRKAKKAYERGICYNSKNNPKAFWSHVRQQLKTKSGVAPLLADKNDPNSTKFLDIEKANILQEQFSSVFIREPLDDILVPEKRTDALIAEIHVTAEMIVKLIEKLNVNKSCGPDQIHPRMLIELRHIISEPLAILMNKTLQEQVIPEDWKQAFVSPIFKKGARNRAANYRPISLTSIVCKLMESIVKESVMNHLLQHGLLSPKQYGFISGRCTATQLLRYLDICVENLVNGEVTDTIYLDFSKAFDTVPHLRLLEKLKSYGISGDIITWVREFLSNRTQIVKVNGEESFTAPVLSGIPQGSVLGPLLFVIYINDIPESILSHAFLFADDTKVFRKISNKRDSVILQEDIKSLESWTEKWLLEFNIDKCHVLTLGKIENIQHTHRYTIADHEFEHVFTLE